MGANPDLLRDNVMTEDQSEKLVNAIIGHGNSVGGNLVHLKSFLQGRQEDQQAFLDKLQQDQQTFLTQQREASDKAQATAHRAAQLSALAAVAAAVAAGFSAYADVRPLVATATAGPPAATALPLKSPR